MITPTIPIESLTVFPPRQTVDNAIHEKSQNSMQLPVLPFSPILSPSEEQAADSVIPSFCVVTAVSASLPLRSENCASTVGPLDGREVAPSIPDL